MRAAWYVCRFKKGVRRKFGLSRALFIAAWYSLRSPADSFSRVRAALLLWFDFARHPDKADHWKYFRRLRTCYRCPIFYRPRKTCGAPGIKEFDGVGCACYMPAKCGIKNAECWGDINDPGNDYGWSAAAERGRDA